ncbi:unnamed protein product [Pylaiella littoralis]
MRISGRYSGDLAEAFVTSSGTTDELETYDFDFFTNEILISGVFSTDLQSISISEEPTTDGFEWSSDSDEAIDRTLTFELAFYAIVDAIEIIDGTAAWNSFDLSSYLAADQYLTEIEIVIKGTDGAPGFSMIDLRVLGAVTDNPTDTVYVGSTFIERWETDRYPDFVAVGSSDQETIMEAICFVKGDTLEGVDCVGGDESATGTTQNIWVRGLYDPETSSDIPAVTGLGSVGISVVGSKVSRADKHLHVKRQTNTLYRAQQCKYASYLMFLLMVSSLPSTGPGRAPDPYSRFSFANIGWFFPAFHPSTQNLTLNDAEIRFIDGDALVVRNSTTINIDAGEYEDHLEGSLRSCRPIPRHRAYGRHVHQCLGSSPHPVRQRSGRYPHHGVHQLHLRCYHRTRKHVGRGKRGHCRRATTDRSDHREFHAGHFQRPAGTIVERSGHDGL